MDPITLGGGSLLIGIICAIACHKIAQSKGRSSGWWGLWGFLFSFIALIIVAILPAKHRAA